MGIKNKFIAIFVLCAMLFLPISPIFGAETALKQAEDEQNQLQQQLQDIENQIAEYQTELKTIKGEKNTLQNKIKQLKNQQASINLQIKSTNLQIKNLNGKISQTKTDVNENISETQKIQDEIADLLRAIKRYDDYPLFYSIITQNRWSAIFTEIEKYLQLTASMDTLVEKNKELKGQLDKRLELLAQEQDDAQNLLSIKVLQQQQLADSVGTQNQLLQKTKGKESSYQTALKANQKKAAEIKGRLYQLLEVSSQITFGEAVKIANWASEQSGVRAVFLLAILTQESNLGKNVGTCNRKGDPPTKSWRAVMKPARDHEPFKQITDELGLDIDTTPVSCPMRDGKGNRIGWGGAMGPAQFIPSTWMGYKDRIAAITGKAADPWDIRDAFLASAIKLKAGGAGDKSGEWAAAMRYFSGSTNTKYRFYGDSVAILAEQYQNDMDSL